MQRIHAKSVGHVLDKDVIITGGMKTMFENMKAGQLWRTSTGVILLFSDEDGVMRNVVLSSERRCTDIAYQGAYSGDELSSMLEVSVYIGSIKEFANLLQENYHV